MADPIPRRHWLWPTRRRFVIGTLIALALWGWLDVRKRARVDPQDHLAHRTDLTVYTEAGAAFFDGRNPYEVTNPRGWGYLYPPLFAIVMAPLHKLETTTQAMVWFAVSLAAAWGCYVELKRIAREVLPDTGIEGVFGRIPAWLGTVAVVASTLPALNCLQRGQVGLVKLYLLLLGMRLILERGSLLKPMIGTSLMALAVTLKITPVVPAGLIVAQQLTTAWYAGRSEYWRTAGTCAVGFAAGLALWILFLPAMAVGWQANLHHLHTWWNAVASKAENTSEDDFAGNSTSVRNQSLANAANRMGNWLHYRFGGGPNDNGSAQVRQGGKGLLMDAPQAERAIFVARLIAGLVLLAVCFRMARSDDALGQTAAFSMACAATLVIFTIARGHYFVLLLPANVFVPLWLLRAGRKYVAWGVAVTPLVLILAHYLALDVTGRVGLLGLGTAVWFFVTTAYMLTVPIVLTSGIAAHTPTTVADSKTNRRQAA
jgi:hypothetical protein